MKDSDVEALLGTVESSAADALAAYTRTLATLDPDAIVSAPGVELELRRAQEKGTARDDPANIVRFERFVAGLRSVSAASILAEAAVQTDLPEDVRREFTRPQDSIPTRGDELRTYPELDALGEAVKGPENVRVEQLAAVLREKVATVEQAGRYAAAAQGMDALNAPAAQTARTLIVGQEQDLGLLGFMMQKADNAATGLTNVAGLLDEHAALVNGPGNEEFNRAAAEHARTAAGSARELHGALEGLRGKWTPSAPSGTTKGMGH